MTRPHCSLDRRISVLTIVAAGGATEVLRLFGYENAARTLFYSSLRCCRAGSLTSVPIHLFCTQGNVDLEINPGSACACSSRIDRKRPLFACARLPCFLVLAIVFVVGNTGLASAQQSTEYKVKAAYLYNFTKFITWPTSSQNPERKSIHICIHGDNPFGSMLVKSVKGRNVRGRSIEVLEVGLSDTSSCDLLFITSSGMSNLNEILLGLPETGVLTVGESDGFLAAGGAIEFVIERDRVRFRINLVPVNRSELSVDSRLLALATKVLKDSGAGK